MEPIERGFTLHRHPGFGLLGHLGEMLQNSPELTVQLDGAAIPAYSGALELFERRLGTWPPPTEQPGDGWRAGSTETAALHALLELLVDPQTCGPLLLGCTKAAAVELTRSGPWIQIGNATTVHG